MLSIGPFHASVVEGGMADEDVSLAKEPGNDPDENGGQGARTVKEDEVCEHDLGEMKQETGTDTPPLVQHWRVESDVDVWQILLNSGCGRVPPARMLDARRPTCGSARLAGRDRPHGARAWPDSSKASSRRGS